MADLNKIRVGGTDYDLNDASALHTSDVVQATGTSTTAVMSQTAVTTALNNKADASAVATLSNTVDGLASSVDDLSADIVTMDSKITGLEGTTHFIGAGDVSARPGTADEGDIYVATDNGKEYIYVGDMWIELGDTTAEQARIAALESTVSTLSPIVDNLADEIIEKADSSTVTNLSNTVTDHAEAISSLESTKVSASVDGKTLILA